MTYKDMDETFLLFEKILIDYLPFANDSEKLKVNDLHNSYFLALEIVKDYSKDKGADNWNQEEKLADAFTFYKSVGLITLEKGSYFIDSEKLKQKFIEYRNHKKNIEEENEFGNSYKKRPRK